MKKIICIFILTFFSGQLYAMEPITDDEMNLITGAVGVHIYVEGDNTAPRFQVLKWQNNIQREISNSAEEGDQNHPHIYEISYDDCELRFNPDKQETIEKNAVSNDRSFVKIGNSTSATEISNGAVHLSFKEVSVSLNHKQGGVIIIPR